jgi:probable O-glycosylation ligase (exosortase A-associated)
VTGPSVVSAEYRVLDGPAQEGLPAGAAVAIMAAAGVVLGAALLLTDARNVMVALVACVLVIVTFWRPFVGVLTYLLVSTLRPEELGLSPATFRLQLVFALVCLAALGLPGLLKGRWRRWEWVGTDRPLAMLFLVALASIPFSVSKLGTFNNCWEFSKLIFAYLLVRRAAVTPARMRAAVWVLVMSAGITAVLAWHGRGSGEVYVGEGGVVRTMGLTSAAGDPDSLANTLICSLPLLAVMLFSERGSAKRLLLAAVAALCLYVTLMTGARAGLISLAVVTLLLVLVSRRKLIVAALLGIALLVLWVRLPQSLKDRYATLQTYRTEATYQTRVETAKLGFRMFEDHPLTGVGLGSFMVARAEEYDGVWLQPHNVYAQVAAEMGVLGIIAFVAFLVSLLNTCRAARRRLPGTGLSIPETRWLDRLCVGLMIVLAALLVQGLAGHNFGRWHYYLGAALATNALAIATAREDDATAKEQARG